MVLSPHTSGRLSHSSGPLNGGQSFGSLSPENDNEVAICLQCGDKGFSNALVYCVKCLKFAVHRYCLDKLPATFDEFVYWFCDGCEVEAPQHFSSLKSKSIQLKDGDDINSKHVEPSFKKKSSKRRKISNVAADRICEVIHSERLCKVDAEIKLTESALLAGDCSSLKVRACDSAASPTAITKEEIPHRSSLLEFDDMNNDVGSEQHHSSDVDFLRKMRTKKIKKKSRREFSSERFMQRLEYSPQEQHCQAYTENNLNDHDESVKLEKKQASPLEADNKTNKKKKKKNKDYARNFSLPENFTQGIGYSLFERPCEPCTENNLIERKESTEVEKKNVSVSDAKMGHSGHQSCNLNAELEVTVTSNQVVEFSPLNKTNKKKRVHTLSTDLQGLKPPENPRCGPDNLSDNATLKNYELAQPLADPIWRGSFNVLNGDGKYDEFEGMVAHMSKKACQKAYEEARLFPTLLDLEMHSKLDVWPKSFQISEPSSDSIALYFFPAHKRYEGMFDHLVEQMMSNELAMRAILENAELLVFTSRDLPLNYWRFQGKYYLWGVFRGKQPSSANHLSNNHVGVKEEGELTEVDELGWKESSEFLSNCSLGS